MVRQHNVARNKLAQGKVPQYPAASRMLEMVSFFIHLSLCDLFISFLIFILSYIRTRVALTASSVHLRKKNNKKKIQKNRLPLLFLSRFCFSAFFCVIVQIQWKKSTKLMEKRLISSDSSSLKNSSFFVCVKFNLWVILTIISSWLMSFLKHTFA